MAREDLSVAEPPSRSLEGRPPRNFHRREFLFISADDFLEEAYRHILGRAVDPSGRESYGPHCRLWIGRVFVLYCLATSAEGRAREVRVEGVAPWAHLYWIFRRIPPLLGFCDRLLGLVDLPAWLAELGGRLDRLEADGKGLARRVETHWTETEARLAELGGRLDRLEADGKELARRVETHWTETEARLAELGGRLDRLETETEARLAELARERTGREERPDLGEVGRFCAIWEERMRGPREEVLKKLSVYLPWLEQAPAGLVVDLGCGRGDWLELVRSRGRDVVGVELNPELVRRGRKRGLPIVGGDAVGFLRRMGENRLALVTAFHLLEHLPPEALIQLVRLCHRALRPDGLAIFETPNPENVLVGSHTFYHDPTHRNPLTPTFMTFLLRDAGFRELKLLRLNPYPKEARVPGDGTLVERFNGHFYGPQDFAIIGRK